MISKLRYSEEEYHYQPVSHTYHKLGVTMNTSVTQMPNSKAKLQERLQAGRITWAWPVIIVFARLIFATPWWPVYGTLIDISCLVLLAWLARREGIRLFDLISFQRQRLGRDLLLGVGLLVSFIILSVAWGMVSGLLIYGASPVPMIFGPLPLWGALYALLVWPIIWAIAEEMTYQGYDWRWAAYRFISSLLIGIVFPILYLRIRRLLPFIIAHWAANFTSVLIFVVLPMMTP